MCRGVIIFKICYKTYTQFFSSFNIAIPHDSNLLYIIKNDLCKFIKRIYYKHICQEMLLLASTMFDNCTAKIKFLVILLCSDFFLSFFLQYFSLLLLK